LNENTIYKSKLLNILGTSMLKWKIYL